MSIFKKVRGFYSEIVFFFAATLDRPITHFLYRNKVYEFNSDNLQNVLPKVFSAVVWFSNEEILFQDALDYSAEDVVIDDSNPDIMIKYNSNQFEYLQENFTKFKKIVKIYPSLGVFQKLNDGVYYDIIWLSDLEKYAVFYSIVSDNLVKARLLSFYEYSENIKNEIISEILMVLTGRESDAPVYINEILSEYDSDFSFVVELEESLSSQSQRTIKIIKLVESIVFSINLKNCPYIVLEASRELQTQYISMFLFGLSIIVLFIVGYYTVIKILNLKTQIKNLNIEYKRMQLEKVEVENKLKKLAPIAAYILPLKKQPDWIKVFSEISLFGSKYSKIRNIKIVRSDKNKFNYDIEIKMNITNIDKYNDYFYNLKKNRKFKVIKAAYIQYKIEYNKIGAVIKAKVVSKRNRR